MSEIALSAALSPGLKPANFGVSEPADPDAFAAIAASLGFTSVQTSAQQQPAPAASLGRIAGAPGNVLPLRALSAAAAGTLPGQPANPVTSAGLQHDGTADVPLKSNRFAPDRFAPDRFAPDRFAPATQALATGLPAGRLPVFDAWLPPQGADGFGPQLTDTADDPGGPLVPLATRQFVAVAGEPVPATAGPPSSGSAPSGAVVTTETPVPLHHPRFAEAFTQQVTVMARDGVQHARITVNPPELGPVELRIVLRNDEATVHFAAQHAAVRDVLEDSMQRLREQFEQAGLRLHDGAVFEQLPQRSPGQAYDPALADADLPVDESAAGGPLAGSTPFVRHGLIDAYA